MRFYFFLSLALHPKLSKNKPIDNLSISGHVLRNLFWKICSLFRQIPITFLKCSRASFSPSSFSKKMPWDEVGKYFFKGVSQNGFQSWMSQTFIKVPANIYLFKVNNVNTRKSCKICSQLTIKTPEWCQWLCQCFLVLLLLSLKKQMLGGMVLYFLGAIFPVFRVSSVSSSTRWLFRWTFFTPAWIHIF